MTVFS